ncbi:MAG: hypothetical protein HUU47_08025 [Bacteroidetes bacterium]|nr:hypothetical protein [Bacteroidota bacterium]
MHDIEPYQNWQNKYTPESDKNSPFYAKNINRNIYSNSVYGYLIHPGWDEFGSETLYLKVLYADYDNLFVIIELLGEWNDCINNDIMFLKRKVIDKFIKSGIDKFLIIGENVLNFHFSGDEYYDEWYQDIENGWIACINFRKHVLDEFSKIKIDYYLIFGGDLDELIWRNNSPQKLYNTVSEIIKHRIG